jgi:recombination protein RecA
VAEFEIVFGTGISKVGEIVALGAQYDIIQKSGAWYSYNGAKIAQGAESAKQFMLDNPETALEIEKKIKERILEGSAAPAKAGAISAADLDDDGLEDDL